MALYHTHRPQRFDAVIGQDHIITTITNQITQGKIAHAYLFSGPRGVGKTTTARLIAKAVNVPTDPKTGEPDNNHPDAKEIAQGKSIDVIEIDAASHTGVDHVREYIIENAQFRPTKLKYKVFIIDEVHMLSTSAFNALLKTLEEPPSHVIFILATTELQKLPATIISRCQRFTFRHVPQSVMVAHLQEIAKEEQVSVDHEVLERIAYKSEGCVRDAVSLLEQVLSLGKSTLTVDDVSYLLPAMLSEEAFVLVEQIIDNDAAAAITQLAALHEQGTNMRHFGDQIIDMARSLMIASVGELPATSDPAVRKKITALTTRVSPQQAIHMLQVLLRYRALFASAPLPQLPLEMAVVELCHETLPTPTQQAPATPTPAATPITQQPITPPPVSSPTTVQPTPVKETPPAMRNVSSQVKKSDVEKQWPAFLKHVEQQSPSLLFILKTATLEEVTDGAIVLSVGHTFHKDKLLDLTNKQKMLAIWHTLLGEEMTLEVLIIEQEEQSPSPDMHELAAAFGGNVVS